MCSLDNKIFPENFSTTISTLLVRLRNYLLVSVLACATDKDMDISLQIFYPKDVSQLTNMDRAYSNPGLPRSSKKKAARDIPRRKLFCGPMAHSAARM